MAALREAYRILKTQGELARVVGVKQQSVAEMLKNGTRVPAEWCLPLEAATAAAGHKISRGQFRPDLWPEEFAALPPTAPEPARHRETPPVALARGLRQLVGGG